MRSPYGALPGQGLVHDLGRASSGGTAVAGAARNLRCCCCCLAALLVTLPGHTILLYICECH